MSETNGSEVTRIIPGRVWETSRAIEHLKDKPIGYLATYAELSEVIRRELPGDGRSYVLSAINYLRREGAVWSCVKTEGYRRLADGEIVEEAGRKLTSARRSAGRAERIVVCADRDKLTAEERRKMDVLLLRRRTWELFMTPTGEKRIAGMIEAGAKTLPPASEVLKLFR
jgi:hypothetical protein